MVYAPIDIFAMSMILNGGNPNFAAILPSGFTILPDKLPGEIRNDQEPEGSILTIAFHIADSTSSEDYIPTATLTTIDTVLTATAASITNAVIPDDNSGIKFVRK